MNKAVTISRANNYIRVFDYKEKFVDEVLMPFCRLHLFKWEDVPDPQTGQVVKKVGNVFARFNHDRTEFRVAIRLLPGLLEVMEQMHYPEGCVNFITEKEINPLPLGEGVKFKEGWGNLRDYQEEWAEYQSDNSSPLKVINGKTGFGKAQTLSSKIKVPGGWTTMGDIQVGDTVITPLGQPTTVTGVFPQGVTEVIRVHFKDGRHTDVNPEHLWKVWNFGRRLDDKGNKVTGCWEIKTTKQLMEIKKSRKQYTPRIQLIEPEDCDDVDLGIHPYLMGVILGDGGITTNTVNISKPFDELFNKVGDLLPDHLKVKWHKDMITFSITFKTKERDKEVIHDIRHHLLKTKLMDKRSWEKFIPDEYLHGSKKQRLELLQGLMDTDGTIVKGKSPSYSSSSKELAEGVQYLVRSLGGIASMYTRVPHYTYKGEKKAGRPEYRVNIRYPKPEELFTLTHKRLRSVKGQYTGTLKLGISHFEERPKEETQCISVSDKEHLYVTDDFIVTHNTVVAIYQMIHGKEKTIIIVQPRYVSVWVKAFVEQLDFFLEDVLILDTNNIEELHKSVKEEIVSPSIYIIPQTKIQMYLKKMKTDSSLPCLDEVFDDMGVGFRIYDEAHEAFHQIYTSLLFGNVKKTSLLSATMKSDDSFTNKMYDIVAPKEIYLKGTEETQYIETYAYHYRIDQRKFFIGHKGFGGNYNDIMFEKSMFRNKVTTKFYLDLILKAFNEYYYERREEGTKCLLFFTKTDTCERVKNFLLKEYPDLDVISFTGLMTKKKDMKDEYLKHEVVVTTPGSCGTGKDIPGLITTVCSHSVSSQQRNIQMIGRLRPTEKLFPNLPPQFVYLVCDDIPKHRDYHRKRKELFHPKSIKQENVNSQMYLN